MSREKLRQAMKDIIPNAIKRAAMAYTGQSNTSGKTPRRRGAGSRQAIVDNHFKAGNTARYGFIPNSPAYAAQKAQEFPGKPQMVRTGLLRESVRGRGDITVPEANPAAARIRWTGLPAYVRHLVTRKRFNLAPDARDQAEIDRVANESVRQDIAVLEVAAGRSGGSGRVEAGQPPLIQPPLKMPPLSS